MKLKSPHFNWIKTGKCPSCHYEIEFVQTGECGIEVNCESKGKVEIPGLWLPSIVCQNPTCKWSKIKEIKEELCIY